MSNISMYIATVIGVIAIIWVLLPIVRRKREEKSTFALQREHDELLTTYERVLATIRDLDDDYRSGKLAEDTYQEERAYWTEQGIALLQKLEPENGNNNESDLLENANPDSNNAVSSLGGIEQAAIPVYN